MRHVVSWQDLSSKEVLLLFKEAKRLKANKRLATPLKGRVLASLFYEPSTRTRLSFETAMLRLGGSIISTENAAEFSSAAKGETLEDTIRVISKYADGIVLRHPEDGAAKRAANVAEIPVINAGDGGNEHPTQALLDLFTIWEACQTKRLSKRSLRFLFLGDNSRSRATRSLIYMLLAHATSLGIKLESIAFGGNGKTSEPSTALLQATVEAGVKIARASLPETDVLYTIRIQKERYAGVKHTKPLVLTKKLVETLPTHAIILHPLPRIDELLPEVDTDPRAWYFKEAENGLYVRMALLELLLKKI